jgi:hypothetical protein
MAVDPTKPERFHGSSAWLGVRLDPGPGFRVDIEGGALQAERRIDLVAQRRWEDLVV